MRKLILNVAMSLDGLIEGPKGEFDWCFTDQDYGMTDFLNRIDSIFYGRKSYEVMMKASEDKNPFESKQSYVFSNSLAKSSKYSIVSGDITKQVIDIKAGDGKDIWLFGGAELTAHLLQQKLVDEIFLAVHPIALGRGKSMFGLLNEKLSLKLIDTKSYSSGLVSLHYSVN